MVIIRKEVKVFRDRMFCECGGEFNVQTILSSFPAKYQHSCNLCNEKEISDYCYHRIIYEEIKEDEIKKI